MRGAGFAVLVLLAACNAANDRSASTAPTGAGPSLERAAVAAGIVVDPATFDPAGAYGGTTDRACLVRRDGALRIGAEVDFGEGQRCIARGTGEGHSTLRIDFGDGCRFDARADAEAIRFPAVLPGACDRRCTGRASLSALIAPRLSGTATEAAATRAGDGGPLCG